MKKSTILSSIALMGIVLTSTSCRRDGFGCIRGTGSTVTETRTVSNFTKIDVDADAEVVIYEDSVYSFSVSAQQNIIDNLESRVSGDELSVREKKCTWHKTKMVITIHAPIVADIELSGSGHITVYKSGMKNISTSTYTVEGSGKIDVNGVVKADNLFVKILGSGDISISTDAIWSSMNISGSGKIIAAGICTTAENFISGSGKIEAFNLETRDNYVDITGSGKTNIYATDNLDVDITGSGKVNYKGWPRLSTRISGSGKIQHVN